MTNPDFTSKLFALGEIALRHGANPSPQDLRAAYVELHEAAASAAYETIMAKLGEATETKKSYARSYELPIVEHPNGHRRGRKLQRLAEELADDIRASKGMHLVAENVDYSDSLRLRRVIEREGFKYFRKAAYHNGLRLPIGNVYAAAS